MLLLAACGGGGGSPSPPGAPTISQAVPADGALVLSLTPPASDGGAAISSYSVTCRSGLLDSNTGNGPSSPVTVMGLTNGREYSCSATARNSAGDGPASAAVTATPYTRPGAPTSVAFTAGDGTIDAAFSPPSNDGGNPVTEYRLTCSAGGTSVTTTGRSSPLRLTGLTNGTAQSCSLTARNAAGESAASPSQSVTPRTLPGAPMITSVVPDFTALVINVAAPASDGGSPVTSYTAQCTGGGVTRTASSTTPRILVGGMTNGTGYSCSVRATNVAGDGAFSAPFAGTPRDLPRESQLTSTIDQAARRATVTWRDVFPAGTSYRVETGPPGATLTNRGVVAVAVGNGSPLSWSFDVSEPTVSRVFAVRPPLGDVSLMSSIYEVFVFVAPVSPSSPPGIAFDKVEPLTGQVRMSIAGGATYSWVDWFVDTRSVGTVMHTEGPGNPIQFNFDGVSTGDHLVTARVQTASSSFAEIKRTVRVANVYVFPDLRTYDGVYHILANVSSASGIASVEATVNGISLGALTAPNCPTCELPEQAYRWRLDPARFPSGAYAIVVTATDKAGIRKSVEFVGQVRYPPVLTLAEPVDYQIVNGRLRFRATARSDRAGGVRTEVKLEQLTILDTTAEDIDVSIDLSGIAPRTYLMTVTTRDSAYVPVTMERTIIITGDPQRVYTPALQLDPAATLVTSDGLHAVWRGTDGLHRLQPFGGAAVTLADSGAAALSNLRQVTISGGWVYALGKGGDCPVSACAYEWSPAGSRRNLSNSNPYIIVNGTRCSDADIKVRGNRVLMVTGGCTGGRPALYDRTNGSYQVFEKPAGTAGVTSADFIDTPAGPVVFLGSYTYAGADFSSGLASMDIHRYFGGAYAILSAAGARSQDPQANGAFVGWKRVPLNGITDPQNTFELLVAGVDGTNVRSIGSAFSSWGISEQAFYWAQVLELNRWAQVSKQVLKAEYNGSVQTISTELSARYLAATQDQIFYRTDVERFMRWSGRDGQSFLVLEAVPSEVWARNGYAVFTLGGGRVYRVPLP